MEEKLLRLFKAIDAYTERSEKYYAEFEYDAILKEVIINIRNKENYEFKETVKFNILKDNVLISIEEIIKNLEGKRC